MNLPFKIARRYLFAKKSTNAINIISGISVFGIAVGTAALILILSVFNGLGEVLTGMINDFNPPLKVLPLEGKTFVIDTLTLDKIKSLDEVQAVSQTLEEIALFEYNNSQDFGTLKGVDEYFSAVTDIDSTIISGDYKLQEDSKQFALIGRGMSHKLDINIYDQFEMLTIYMAKKKSSALGNDFKKKLVQPIGIFQQQEVDHEYILASLPFVQNLLGKKHALSALEIKLNEGVDEKKAALAIQEIVGNTFEIKNKFEQNASIFKIMRLEKWISFAILSLTLVLVAFNMIGALWMIVLDKKKDIAILKSMGVQNNGIRNIFLNEGLMLSVAGIILGFFIALIFYILQKNYGIIALAEGAAVDAYPISMYLFDLIIVTFTVLLIGLLASLPPAMRAARVTALVRDA